MRSLALAIGLAGIAPLTLNAQARPVEFGVDAAFQLAVNGRTVTTFSLPSSRFRVGVFTSDAFSIEPDLSFQWVKADGFDGLTTIVFGLSGLYHFATDVAAPRPYVRPRLGLLAVSGTGPVRAQAQAGVGLGALMPLVDRIAARLEASYSHSFATNSFSGANFVSVLFGLSAFTR